MTDTGMAEQQSTASEPFPYSLTLLKVCSKHEKEISHATGCD